MISKIVIHFYGIYNIGYILHPEKLKDTVYNARLRLDGTTLFAQRKPDVHFQKKTIAAHTFLQILNIFSRALQ